METDLEKAIQILKDLPARDERILSSPPPNVIVQEFNSSSIAYNCLSGCEI
jgi:small-conductance mechanosensitive channel